MNLNSVRKNPFGFIALQLLFWLLLFFLARLIFILYQLPHMVDVGIASILQSFYYGLKMDLSMTAYLLLLPYLAISIGQFFRAHNALYQIVRFYHLIFILLVAIIVSTELELFVEWETKLNTKALSYLKNPSEVWGVTSVKVLLINIFVFALMMASAHILYGRLIGKKLQLESKLLTKITFILITPLLLIIMLRGGLQQIPINQSIAYFSKNNTLNNASVNSAWNLAFGVLNNQHAADGNPYEFYESQKAESFIEGLNVVNEDSATSILTTSKPNLVLILLESWSSDVVGSLGGYEGITPRFDELSKNGLLFSNIYAAGLRSHEGMGAIFSGFPALPEGAITNDPSKYYGLPVMNKTLAESGYQSLFGFGGELEYGNIKSYMRYAGFDKLIEGSDFDEETPRVKLGVHDQYAFERYLHEIDELNAPFFASWFTLSSHAPYDIPEEYNLDINGLETGYINSIHYTDKYLGKFIEAASTKPWFNNTLFVIMADHGHSSPKKRAFYDSDYRKIPLLLYGNVLKTTYSGKQLSTYGSQTDIPAILLNQLNIDASQFKWSKDLINPTAKSFAYYVFDDGFGWIQPEGGLSYHLKMNKELWSNLPNDSLQENFMNKGRSYLQLSFDQYLDN